MIEKKSRQRGANAAGGGDGNERPHPYRSTASANSQPIRSAAGQIIGHVAGGVFSKRVQASKHMLRAPRGWALDAVTLDELRARCVVTVAVTDTETGTRYTAPLAEFSAHGVAFNRGFGPQVALPLGYWSVDGQPPALAAREPDPDAPRQLALFGEVAP